MLNAIIKVLAMSLWKRLFERKHSLSDGIIFIGSFILIVFIEPKIQNQLFKDALIGITLIGLISYLGYMLFYRKISCGWCLAGFIWFLIALSIFIYELVTGAKVP